MIKILTTDKGTIPVILRRLDIVRKVCVALMGSMVGAFLFWYAIQFSGSDFGAIRTHIVPQLSISMNKLLIGWLTAALVLSDRLHSDNFITIE